MDRATEGLALTTSQFVVHKWLCGPDGERLTDDPYETVVGHGNATTYGGISAVIDALIGAGTLDPFDNTNAYIGVGDSSTAVAAGQTDLQAPTNKDRRAMDATFPQHTDGTSVSNASVVFKATFPAGTASFAWNEWGVFNASTGGRMLNRKVQSLGTKGGSEEWSLTVTIARP
jgi:hypothetical protein